MKVLPHLSNLKGILGALVAVFAVCACDDEELPVDLNLSVSPKEVTLPADGGTATVSITSPLAWTVTSEAAWVTVSPASGESGTSTITLTVEANTSTSDREALVKVTLKDVALSQSVKVIQRGKEEQPPFEYKLSVSPAKLDFQAAGGSNSLSVTANEAWTASADANWITVTPASGNGNGTVTVKVQENTVEQKREGAITFTCGDKNVTVAVAQEAKEPFVYQLSVSPSSLNYEAVGGTLSVSVSANEAWTASASASWITVTPASGNGNGTVSIKADENRTENAKEGKVTFTCGDKTAEVKVSQAPKVRTEVPGFKAGIEGWASGTLTIGKEFVPPYTEAEWAVYDVVLDESFPMEKTDDGLFTAIVKGYSVATPLFIVRDDTKYFGSVYKLAYSPFGADGKEYNSLMYTNNTDHAIFSHFNTNIRVTLDPAELSITIEDAANWVSIGEGEFVDGFVSTLFGCCARPVTVEIQQDKNDPSLYRIVEPYANLAGWFNYSPEEAELIMRINEDGTAFFKETFTGISHDTYGEFYVFSLVPENGLSNYQDYGQYVEEEKTAYFLERTAITLSNYGSYYTNNQGYMSVTLPGGSRSAKVVSIDYFAAGAESMYAVVTHDVDTVKYAIIGGTLTEEEVVAAVPDIRASQDELEISIWGEAELNYTLGPGEFTAIVVAQGAGKEVYAYQNFTVEE